MNRTTSVRLFQPTRRPLRPVTGKVSIFLKITTSRAVSKLYRAVRLHPHPEVAKKAWQLQQPHGVSYHTWTDPQGHGHCDCPDHSFNGHKRDGCKHLKALTVAGLL